MPAAAVRSFSVRDSASRVRFSPVCQTKSGPVLRWVNLSFKYCVMARTGQVDVPVAGIARDTVCRN